MAIPNWIHITPTTGSSGQTQVNVKCDENTGMDREAEIKFVNNNKTAILKITQEGALRIVANIRPNPIAQIITGTEDLSDFNVTGYRITIDQDITSTSALEEIIMDGLDGQFPSNILINWSPYGEENFCDYTYAHANDNSWSSASAAYINPSVTGTPYARWRLNTVMVGVDIYYNLPQAAFHQGSPIIEIAYTSAGWFIYTLDAFYKDARSTAQSQVLSISGVLGIDQTTMTSASATPTILNTMPNIISNAGKIEFNVTGSKPAENGVTRIWLSQSNMVNSSDKWRILKWYYNWNTASLVAVVSIGTTAQAGKFSPTASFAVSQINTLTWKDSFDALCASSSILTPNSFYNPTL